MKQSALAGDPVIGSLMTPQPRPTANSRPAVWDLVVIDIRERDRMGEAQYGTRLQPHNGRDPLVDAYQEALDLVVYLRQEIQEREDLRAELARLRADLARLREGR